MEDLYGLLEYHCSALGAQKCGELPNQYSLPHPPHYVKVPLEIMQRGQGGKRHLTCQEQMAKIGPRKAAARVAAAGFVDGFRVVLILRLLDEDPACAI
jgi:hypothetical protein